MSIMDLVRRQPRERVFIEARYSGLIEPYGICRNVKKIPVDANVLDINAFGGRLKLVGNYDDQRRTWNTVESKTESNATVLIGNIHDMLPRILITEDGRIFVAESICAIPSLLKEEVDGTIGYLTRDFDGSFDALYSKFDGKSRAKSRST